MTNRLLTSVAAAALIAGTSFAFAQGTGTSQSPSSGAATQHTAPSTGGASSGAMERDTGGMKSSDQSSTKGSESSKSAQDTAGQKSKSMSSDNHMSKDSKDMKAEGRDSKDMKAEGRDSKNGNMNAQTKGATDSTNAQNKSGTNTNAAQSKSPTDTNTNAAQNKNSTTTGNAATSATAAPPAEKRTQITSAIKSEHVTDEGSRINVNVAVGATLPASVHYYPVPSRVVEIYPEWRGYEFVLVHGRYVIVRPQTHEVVYIIEG
jgi:hypothetical protein